MPACGDVISQVVAEHPQLAELRSVTVLGITGSTLLEAATVSSMQDLNQQAELRALLLFGMTHFKKQTKPEGAH